MPEVINKITAAGDFKIADANEIEADNFGDLSIMEDFVYGEFWGSSRDLGTDEIAHRLLSGASALESNIDIPASAPNTFLYIQRYCSCSRAR